MKTIKLTLLLAMLVFAFGCTKDQNPTQIDETELSTDLKSADIFRKEIVIEWHDGVKEERKDEVRDYYMTKDILRLYILCKENNFETWTINCQTGRCGRESDTPVETDDDVKRISFDLSLCDKLD